MRPSDTTPPAEGQSPDRGSGEPAPDATTVGRRPENLGESRRIGPVYRHELLWLVLSLGFNLAWELAQLGFYDLSATRTSVAYAVVHCTLGDGIIMAIAYATAAGITRSRFWPYKKPWLGMAVVLVSTIGYTAFSEWRNVYLIHAWAYAASMPLVAGIGAAPLLQWLVVPVATLTLVRRYQP